MYKVSRVESLLGMITEDTTSFEDCVLKLDKEFNSGHITQKEWANLYQILCERDIDNTEDF